MAIEKELLDQLLAGSDPNEVFAKERPETSQLVSAGLCSRKADPAMANAPDTQAALIAMAEATRHA